MRGVWLTSLLVLLGGCAVPPAISVASLVADGFSYFATGKSVADHGISMVAGEDCAVFRAAKGEVICREEGQDSTAMAFAPAEEEEDLLYTLYFDSGSARIKPAGTRAIDTVAGTVGGPAASTVTLGGHADRAGTEAYNLDLSLKRALSVYDALVRKGIPPSRIIMSAFGETRPKVPTEDGVREAINRRVEVLINAR